MINWNDLKFLLATARAGSYSLAAQELGVNRTTVARRINALETQLKYPLFENTPEGYRLTECGLKVLERAKQLQREVSLLEEQIPKEDHELKGSLRVATPLGLGPEFMRELAQFSLKFPGIKMELINTIDPMASINLRKADVGIGVGHSVPDYLQGTRAGELTRAIYASNRYLKQFPEEKALNKHQWIGWGKEMSHTHVAKWMQHHLAAETQINLRVNSWHALREAVVQGLGIAHLWCFLAQENKQLQKLDEPDEELAIDLWLFQHSELPSNPRIEAFMQTLYPLLNQRISPS